MKIEVYNVINTVSTLERKSIIDFLFEHLDEFGDDWDHIQNAVEYALNPTPGFGGFILFTREKEEIIGAVVMNKTGMQGYIPENTLVYIAVHRNHRGKGIGKKLMQKAIQLTNGDIALHVEEDNPARFLYENVGFESPYLEMRYYKNNNG
jgi:ribosomal protein S18 acetylase RimI-like enzyme